MNFLPRLLALKARLKEIERIAQSGKVRRQDTWTASYCRHPYMIRLDDAAFHQRFLDIYINIAGLNDDGKISIHLNKLPGDDLLIKWSHVLDELSTRNLALSETISRANNVLNAYFTNGIPAGVKLFDGIERPRSPFLVKFSRLDFLERMHQYGEIRVSPASSYANGNLLYAMQDLETKRDYTIPTYDKLIEGYSAVSINGTVYNVRNADPTISTEVPDYYLYSLCTDMDRRMPTDFESDAALIIKDRGKFIRRFSAALKNQLPGWKIRSGPVSYYDPLVDFQRFRFPQMTKHIRFLYQKEFRIVATPRGTSPAVLEPFFINIGPMDSYSLIARI